VNLLKPQAAARAKSVFETEAKAILDTGKHMDWTAFAKAARLLATAERIAVSGCGHSGIACAHFAHSLCCVERPARFLPPSEAVHGGTGFLQAGDVLVAASRGGKTAELLPIMEIARRKGARVITITENSASPMARLSEVVLPLVVHREADRYNMQGTSSFSALSAVFDALQTAVMEETGYQREQFAVTHPGGAVGEKFKGENNG
jgi:D-arabinose 5-phosphate isomerase GutQ